jgi:hypothetical protein
MSFGVPTSLAACKPPNLGRSRGGLRRWRQSRVSNNTNGRRVLLIRYRLDWADRDKMGRLYSTFKQRPFPFHETLRSRWVWWTPTGWKIVTLKDSNNKMKRRGGSSSVGNRHRIQLRVDEDIAMIVKVIDGGHVTSDSIFFFPSALCMRLNVFMGCSTSRSLLRNPIT